jgi:beta-galactosidase
MRFLTEPVRITVTGPARLIGPDMVVLAGGAAGFWLRATGMAGEITVTLTSSRFPETRISITAA